MGFEQAHNNYLVDDQASVLDTLRAQALNFCDQFFDALPPIMIVDLSGYIVFVSQVFCQFTGYSKAEVVGQKPSLLSAGKTPKELYAQLWQALHETGTWQGELQNKTKQGHCFIEKLSIQTLYDNNNAPLCYLGSFSDITDAKNNEKALDYLNHYDPLSGLLNKEHFVHELDVIQKNNYQNNSRGCLFYFQLTFLNEFNVHYGQHETDAAILNYIDQIKQLLTCYDYILGRASGSGFVLAIYGLHGLQEQDFEKVIQLLLGMFQGISSHHHLPQTDETVPFDVGTKIGICTFPSQINGQLESAETLLRNAMLAVQSVQDTNQNHAFYSEALDSSFRTLHNLDVALYSAIEKLNQFELYHQPQVDDTGRKVGGETLIRWKCNGEYISPAVFIPMAEKSGAIIKITYWVLNQAIAQLKELIKLDLMDIYPTFSVNFSPKCIMDLGIMQYLKEQVDLMPVIAQHIKIEITETAFVNDFDALKKRIDEIKLLGFRVSIDDFGTGYSSLSYLSELDFDELKIDKSFVDKLLPESADSDRIIKAIIGIARTLNATVVAEGVETQAQFSQLRALNCDHFQGYLFSKPICFDELVVQLKLQKLGRFIGVID